MKRAVFIAILLVMVFTSVELFAQEESSDRPQIQTLNVQIQRVYRHSLGYKVIYNRTDLYPAEAYIPGRWFTAAAGKGEIVYSSHPSVPYMQIVWMDGEFDHVRLYVNENPMDRSWGSLPSDADVRDKFAIETLDLQF